MDLKRLAATLHPLERKVLPALAEAGTVDELVEKSGLKKVEVVRALQWLENKGLVETETSSTEQVVLEDNGVAYKTEGLPERRFLDALPARNSIPVDELLKTGKLSKEELNACIGKLRKKGFIDLQKEDGRLSFSLTAKGKKGRKKKLGEESFLEKDFPVSKKDLSAAQQKVMEELSDRKDMLRVEVIKETSANLTSDGKKLLDSGIDESDVIERVTSDLIKSGDWKDKEFRRFDVTADIPKISGGRRHFVNQAIDYIRNIWIEMGFTEMEGSLVQTAFWNMDALFTPQDHPARDLQDTFYLEDPDQGNLPSTKLVKQVKAVHEDGGDTGSTGWRSDWDKKNASRNLLRTHTTVLSAKALAGLKKEDLPAKFFAVGKVFRNETLDWSHLFEFTQVEGIVVDPDANLRHLKGYLQEFYSKMGFTKIRMVPSYFPYTEPSMEVFAYNPLQEEWVEVGGAGIFRPEVVKPLLGMEVPVLAWGQGLERIIVEYFKIKDLRDLYRNDLKQLRTIKAWMR